MYVDAMSDEAYRKGQATKAATDDSNGEVRVILESAIVHVRGGPCGRIKVRFRRAARLEVAGEGVMVYAFV